MSAWNLVSAQSPCPICKHDDWCQTSKDGAVRMCMRTEPGSFKTKQTASGATAYFHQLIPREKTARGKSVDCEPDGSRADADTLHAVYAAMLQELCLSDKHRLDLARRKAPQPFADHLYRSLPVKGRGRAVSKLREKFSDETLGKVPGIVIKKNGKGEKYITISGTAGLLIPVRDDIGRIVGVKVRLGDAAGGGGGKYRWLSSKKEGGPGPGTPAHVPLGITLPVPVVRVTEGPLKADVASCNSEVPTVAADSATNWRAALELLKRTGATTVRLAFDMDRDKRQVAAALVKFALAIIEAGMTLEVETWPAEFKGIDDLLAAGKTPEVVPATESLAYLQLLAEKSGQVDDDGRIEIEIDVDEHKTNDAAADALARDAEIYQREGQLVWIRKGDDAEDAIRRPEDMPRIASMKLATLRERLSRVARFGQTVETDDGPKFERKPIPQKCVEAIFSRGSWQGIRPLSGVVSAPVLRKDGSILNSPGYDSATRLVFEPGGTRFVIPENPTRQDAVAACSRLLDLVCDFPFVSKAHRSAWLAGLLTTLARHAFDGPAPLFLFDGNLRGVGKTLLAELIALIVTGTDFSRMNNPTNDAECRKLITSLVLFGDTLVLIDNITGVLGCSALDSALTGTVWKDRKLGVNEITIGPLLMTWFASANNAILNGDTTRRTCHCRLESPEERPEERSTFKIPNLAEHVRNNRQALLVDALTILSAFWVAGKPQANLRPWGSFEGWSKLIRQSVVWLRLDDPGETRQELTKRSDQDAENLRGLIAGWEEIDLDCSGLTAAEALRRMDKDKAGFPRLRAVLAEIYDLKPGELPGARKLGRKLQSFRGRACGGKILDDRGDDGHGSKIWHVIDMVKRDQTEGHSGSPESSGSRTATLPRDEATINPTRIKAIESMGPALPENPALPEVRSNGHPGHSHNGRDPLPGDIRHKAGDCGSLKWWRADDGQHYCGGCFPCLDRRILIAEGVLS